MRTAIKSFKNKPIEELYRAAEAQLSIKQKLKDLIPQEQSWQW